MNFGWWNGMKWLKDSKLHGVCMAMGATYMFYTPQNSASIEIRILTETMRWK